MPRSTPTLISSDELADVLHSQDQITTAVVEDISPDGVAKVLLSGQAQPCDASSLLRFPSAAAASEALLGRTVLVLLNRETPIILGPVAQRLWDDRAGEGVVEAEAKLPAGQPMSAQIDKRRVDLEATDEIRLTCGKSSLVMRRDGTVIVRGVKIVSRATESNKIRGGTVSIN